MIVRESGSGTRLAMEGFFLEHAIKPRIDMEMGSNEAIKQAVVAGLGISFISQHTLGLEYSTGRLAVLKVEGTPVIRRWYLVRHKSKRLTPALGAFWDFVLEFARATSKAGMKLRCEPAAWCPATFCPWFRWRDAFRRQARRCPCHNTPSP